MKSVIKNKLDACAGSIRLHSAAHRVAAMLGSWPHGLGEAKPMTWPCTRAHTTNLYDRTADEITLDDVEPFTI